MVKIETKQSDAEQLVRSKLDELIQFRSQTDDIKEFWGKQFDLGLAWVQYPEGAGGLGINPKYQLLVTEILREQGCLLYTSPSPRDRQKSRMPSSA